MQLLILLKLAKFDYERLKETKSKLSKQIPALNKAGKKEEAAKVVEESKEVGKKIDEFRFITLQRAVHEISPFSKFESIYFWKTL